MYHNMPVAIVTHTKHHYEVMPVGYACAVEIQAARLIWNDMNEHIARIGVGECNECIGDCCIPMILGSAMPGLIAAFKRVLHSMTIFATGAKSRCGPALSLKILNMWVGVGSCGARERGAKFPTK